MASADHEHGRTLDEVRVRRIRLRGAMAALEAALAAPVPGRAGEWWLGVEDCLRDLRSALAEHVRNAEVEGGLFAQILDEAPRLAYAVTRLRQEHVELADAIDVLLVRPVPSDGDTDAIREGGLDLLGRLARHRHKGADLLYEAYSVDVSAAD